MGVFLGNVRGVYILNDVERDTLEWEVKRQLARDVKHLKDVEKDQLEWELKQRNEVAQILAKQLNEKIDECEELKSEVAKLNDLILSMTKHIK